ncbi:hypothetical protein FRB96_005844 [Tulasnella sp. 330]|nr:hypothetical protein FRB96_005844 [Tulasnella sp. 330]KAG8870841.1 hypothetical protein FRB97_009330 [Tulasnella sp. 331]KAG8873688.1 hypothetical protein FRB98_008847 [Tulasnella sp. 332]
MLHKNDSTVSIDSTHTIPSYVPPSSSPSKAVRIGVFASRIVALKDMENDMAWVQEFIDGNAEFVKQSQISRFRDVVAKHKEQMERASGRSFFSNYLNHSGHVKTQLLYEDLQTLMKQLKDMATEVVLRRAKQKVEKRHRKTRVDTIHERTEAPGSSNATSVETGHTISEGHVKSRLMPKDLYTDDLYEQLLNNSRMAIYVDIKGVLLRAQEVSK